MQGTTTGRASALIATALVLFVSSAFAGLDRSTADTSAADFPRLAGETDDAPRLQRAIDATKGGVLYLPRGDYAISSTLVISNRCSLLLHKSATLRAVTEMEYVLRVNHAGIWDKLDFLCFIRGGAIDGNGLSSCLLLEGYWRQSLDDIKFFNGRQYGLYVRRGGAEIVANGLYFLCGAQGPGGNTAMYLQGGDSHFTDVHIRGWATGVVVKGGSNRLTRFDVKGCALPGSTAFRIEGDSTILRDCTADTVQIGFDVQGAWETRLLGCDYANDGDLGLNDLLAVRQIGNSGSLLVADCEFSRSSPDERICVYYGNGLVKWRDILYAGDDWTGVVRPDRAAADSNLPRIASDRGLVAHFTFDDASRFGFDSVRQAEIGTVYNTSIMSAATAAPTSCEAPIMRGMAIATGWWQNNYMQVPGELFGSTYGIPYGNQAVTYSLWIKPSPGWQTSGSLGVGVTCCLLRHGSPGYEWYGGELSHKNIYIMKDSSSGDPKIAFGVGEWDSAATSAIYVTPNLFDGNWHFVAATHAGRTLALYYDGQKVAETELTVDVTMGDNRPLTFGHEAADYDHYAANRYMGSADDIKVYNRALDASEILAAYTSGVVAHDSDILAWVGPAAGGAVENLGHWVADSNRRTAEDVYAAGPVMDLRDVADGGTVTHNANATLTLRGAISTNDVTLRMQSGALALKRPSTQRGLVAHFSFDDPSQILLDSGAAEIPATTNVWTYNGTESTARPIQSVVGANGKAMSFPGSGRSGYWPSTWMETDASATTKANGIPCGNEAVTYSLWIKPYATGRWNDNMTGLASSRFKWVFRRGTWGDGKATYLWLEKGSNDGRLLWSIADYAGADYTAAYEPSNLFDGNWHHVVCAYASQTLKLYYDGAKVAEKAVSIKLNVSDGSPIILGNNRADRGQNENYERYLGGFDEFKVFNVALTDDEVAAEYALRSRTLDRTSPGTVPSSAAIQLDAGTTAEVRGLGHEYDSLTGAGSMNMAPGSELTLDGMFALGGELTGSGAITTAGLTLGGDTDAFAGDFTIAEDARIAVSGNGRMLSSTFGGRVILPAEATAVWGNGPRNGVATVAAASLETPAAGFGTWKDEKGHVLTVRVVNGNTLLIENTWQREDTATVLIVQ